MGAPFRVGLTPPRPLRRRRRGLRERTRRPRSFFARASALRRAATAPGLERQTRSRRSSACSSRSRRRRVAVALAGLPRARRPSTRARRRYAIRRAVMPCASIAAGPAIRNDPRREPTRTRRSTAAPSAPDLSGPFAPGLRRRGRKCPRAFRRSARTLVPHPLVRARPLAGPHGPPEERGDAEDRPRREVRRRRRRRARARVTHALDGQSTIPRSSTR